MPDAATHSPFESIEEIARNALARRVETSPEAVPGVLVAALADGAGERSDVERVGRGFAGSDPPLELVLFDTDRIGTWVFESSRPPVLQGASSILEGLNHDLGVSHREAAIFSGGGEGLFLVPGGHGAKLAEEIEERYLQATEGALTVTTAVLPVSPADFVSRGSGEATHGAVRRVDGTIAVLSRIRDLARRVKETRLPPRRPVVGNLPRCTSCRDRAGEVPHRFRQDEGSLCKPCDRRWEVGRREIAGESFDDLVASFVGGEAELEEATRSSYLGFLYADGNALGALFSRLASLRDLRRASRGVTGAFAGLRRRARAEVQRLLAGRKPPLLTLLGGGDETILIAPAALAVHLATRLPAWLDEEVEARPELIDLLDRHRRPRPSLGMGLALAPLGYPVRYQYGLAQQLQASAKTLFYAAGGEEAISALDFEVMTDGNPRAEDLATARRATFSTDEPGFLRTCRPYRREALAELVALGRSARRLGFADSQLRALQEGAGEGRAVFLNLLLYQLARKGLVDEYSSWLAESGVTLGERHQVEAHFIRPSGTLGPAKPSRGTWITDLLELLPFLDRLDDLATAGNEEEVPDAAA